MIRAICLLLTPLLVAALLCVGLVRLVRDMCGKICQKRR